MKLITAIIKPFKLDDVKDALKGAGVAGHDRHRGAGLRPPGRPHRGVPGRRVHGRLRAQGASSRSLVRRRRRRPRSSTSSQTAARTGKIGDGKIWVIDVEPGRCGSAPASATPTPSEFSKAETVRARAAIAALRARRSSMLSPTLIERGRR